MRNLSLFIGSYQALRIFQSSTAYEERSKLPESEKYTGQRPKMHLHLFGDWNKTQPPHLGSEISAACRTRPQYVLRSYCEAGSSRFPGIEADMAGCTLGICLEAPQSAAFK